MLNLTLLTNSIIIIISIVIICGSAYLCCAGKRGK